MTGVAKRRLLALCALLFAGGVVAYIASGDIGENLVYFWSAKDLHDKGDAAIGAQVRLGGVVQAGSVKWDSDSLDLRFGLGMQADPAVDGVSIAVHARRAPPPRGRAGIGVVVEGVYDGRLFAANRVLVKHSNEYRAPESGERAEDIYKTLLEAPGE